MPNIRIIDIADEIKITNTEHLPRGLGAPFLEVIEAPWPNEFAALRWRRKLPKSLPGYKAIIRFRDYK